MANSTAEYWDVDGTSLQTYCWNIESWTDGEMPPPLRGDNLIVPHRAGAVWTPKVPDQRTLSLAMWVIGADQNGVPGPQFRSNVKALRKLLWNPHRQMTMTKRWNGGQASGKGQYAGGLEFEGTGPRRATFAVDLLMADPFLYSAQQQIGPLAVGTSNVTVQGDSASPRHTVLFTGPLTNPSIQVKAGSTMLSTVSYGGTLSAGQTLQVAFPDFVASGVSPLNVSRQQPWWVVLDPATTQIVVGGSGAGSVTLTYEPAWL